MSVIRIGDCDVVDEAVDENGDSCDPPSAQPISSSIRPAATPVQRRSRHGVVLGLVAVALLGALTAWLGSQVQAAHAFEQGYAKFLESGRQSAIMLTTVNHGEVEADAARIIDSSTGAFLEDFRMRSRNFIDTVKRTQSTMEGTVAEAGLESIRGDQADVLVTVSVKTSLAEVNSPARLWRLRITVQKVGDDMKLADVKFIE